ncbi:hypothetical protein NC651_020564 [Populus alba x Populus x berolinensis]|nr:hypothetical protein NC651_020564 [Populus alba x Populus x berolinensis]
MLSSPLHSSPLQTIKSSLSASSTEMRDRRRLPHTAPFTSLHTAVSVPSSPLPTVTPPSPPINSKIRYSRSESIAVLSPINCPLQQQQRKGVGVADNNKNEGSKMLEFCKTLSAYK